MRGRGIIALLALLAGAGAQAEPGSTAGTSVLPREVAVLSGAEVAGMLSQCSRGTPPGGEGSWQPGSQDIAALERALPNALAARHADIARRFAHDWYRQYVGIVRGGRRTIYGNYFPAGIADRSGRWRSEPVIVCDGGDAFFGVEFDPATRQFTHLAFNGQA
jgi:hypothetical protein